MRIWQKSTQPIRCRSSLNVPGSYLKDPDAICSIRNPIDRLCLCD